MAQEGQVRGYRKLLAEQAGCQPAYLSQVLKGNVHLTPEQADRLCRFWELGEAEGELFFALVHLGRAGSPGLKRRLHEKIQALKAQLRKRQSSFEKPELSMSDRALLYYSNWLFSALHVLVTVPSLRTADALAKHFGLSKNEVMQSLQKLEEIGLLNREKEKWAVTQMSLHAPRGSATAEIHHRNWRARAMGLTEQEAGTCRRYTSVQTHSAEDLLRIRAVLDAAIRDTRRIIEPSSEEKATCLVLDFFEIK